jgi:hypothetical protein
MVVHFLFFYCFDCYAILVHGFSCLISFIFPYGFDVVAGI